MYTASSCRSCLGIARREALAGVETILDRRGFLFEQADSAATAVELVRHRFFEVILLAPSSEAEGVEALAALRALPRGEAAVALVAIEPRPPATVRRLLEAGAFAVLAGLDPGPLEAELVRVEWELERRAARRVPADPTERFEQLFEKNPNPMWFYALDSLAFLEVNEAAVQKYGYSRDEFLRMTLQDVRPGEDVPQLLRAVDRARAGLRVSGTYRHRKRDGTIFPVEILAYATTFQGRPASLIVALDVSERKSLEARLALSDRLATVGSMAAGVAHEINNPLTYVLANLGYVRAALGALPPGSVAGAAGLIEALEEAERGSERVQEIVRDLRTLARGNDSPPQPLAVRRVIEGALSMAMAQIRHRARLVTEWSPVPPVLACEGKLGQVFLNLLLNAAQAIPVGKSDQNRIVISTAAEPGWVVCTVSDTGAGIAPEIIGHIFDPFFTTKEPGEGTGLGLSICHGIVTSLGGTITVESEPGRGARFVVRLPAHGSELPAPRPAVARAPQPTSLPRRRVLVIDDEELIGRSVRRVLEGECDTEVEPSPARALERLRAGERFDLVLCDIMMPRFSGVDFYERVREAVPAALGRIAFITGGAFAPRERQFLESSGVAWLEKPIQFSMLRDLLWGRRA